MQYEDRKQEAMDKLVTFFVGMYISQIIPNLQEKQFENYLLSDGKFSSDMLVKIFEDIHHSTGDLGEKPAPDDKMQRPTSAGTRGQDLC